MSDKKIAKPFIYPVIILLKNLRLLGSVSVRLTKLTGKSPHPIHPKHLVPHSKWFLEFLKKNDAILDLGSNDGSNSLIAARASKSVTAIEKNPKLLELSGKRASEQGLKNITFFPGDLERPLPFETSSFDAVLFLDVLEHLNNQDLVLAEVDRVLKKNGRLFLAVPNSETGWKRWQREFGIKSFTDPDHKREYTKEEIQKILKDHHLRPIQITPITFDTPFAPLVDLVGGFSIRLYSFFQKMKHQRALDDPNESIGFQIIAVKQ